MVEGLGHPRPRVVLLDADPDLGRDLGGQEFEVARAQSVAHVIKLDGPVWDTTAAADTAEAGWLGLFVLDGLLIRRVTVGQRSACELFGPGDVLRPWDSDGDYDPLPISVAWLVLRPSRLAAVTHVSRTHPRLLLLFWLLAERWGRVGPDGVHVTLPLTHEVLAMLVGSHRPSVTIALQRLARAGLLTRQGPDRWVLTSRAVEVLAHPESLALIGEADVAPESASRS
jgi:hypothetical protein